MKVNQHSSCLWRLSELFQLAILKARVIMPIQQHQDRLVTIQDMAMAPAVLQDKLVRILDKALIGCLPCIGSLSSVFLLLKSFYLGS
jgi:hypothetical protein